jgi:membrane-associated phospholipid phosphatase
LVCLFIGGILHVWAHKTQVAKVWYWIGLSFILSRLTAGTLKNAFGRLRPEEALAKGLDDPGFFLHGNSFPSGHTAHFWGLMLPIVFAYPRSWLLLLIPVLVSASRILVNDHYLSDVLAAVLISLCVTIAMRKLLDRLWPDAVK